MLRAVEPEDYGRGTLGECLDVLPYENENVVAKTHIAIKRLSCCSRTQIEHKPSERPRLP